MNVFSFVKKGIVMFNDIVDLLYNSGCIYFEQKNYKMAYILFSLTDYFCKENGKQYNTANYLLNLNMLYNKAPYSEMSETDAKMFYWLWKNENKDFHKDIKDNTNKFIENLYEVTLASTQCSYVPRQIKQSVMNYVLYSIKCRYAIEIDNNQEKQYFAKMINYFVDFKDGLRRFYKINVAICGIGNKAFLIKDVLCLDSVNIKAYITDNPKAREFQNIPVIPSTVAMQDEYDYLIMSESNYVKKLSIHNMNKLINYESYLKLIFTNSHNWSVYLNSLGQINDSDGIISGISYAMRGISATYLSKKMCKIAASRQDLYYDLMLLKEILTTNKRNLKYCILCLAKYSFEYDLSLSSQKWLLGYYYYRTHSIHNSKDTALKNDIDKIDLFNNVIFLEDHPIRFVSNYKALCDQELHKYNNQVFNSNCLDDNLKKELITEIQKDFNKNYPLTVRENIEIFEKILKLLNENNIKPIVVVCPVTEFYKSHINGSRVLNDFEKTISYFQNQYGFQYLDYFESSFFNEDDFRDSSHLNLKGAEKFTRLLDSEIVW